MSDTIKRGRPVGSRNVRDVVDVPASRCPKCDSTRKTILHRTDQEYGGIDPNGQPYTLIIRRLVRCLDCQQCRIDRTYENHPKSIHGVDNNTNGS